MAKIIVCPDCGEEKVHYAKGLCKTSYNRRWCQENPEKRAAQGRRYYQAHKKEKAAYDRCHHEEHREKDATYYRRWAQENRDKLAANYRRWQRANPGNGTVRQARRRARKRSLPDTLTREQADHLFEIGQATYPGEDLHLDHIVPLSKGGGTTRANMHAIPAGLNQSKNDALPEEVYQQGSLL